MVEFQTLLVPQLAGVFLHTHVVPAASGAERSGQLIMHLHCSFLQEKPVSQGTAPGQEQRHVVVFQVKGEVQFWVFEQSHVLVVGLKVLPLGQPT